MTRGAIRTSTYDALNHRVEYQDGVANTTTFYAFNLAGQRVGTYDSTLTQQLEEVYWGSEPVAFLNSSNQMNFHFQDYIGSARLDWLGQGMPDTVYGDIWRPFGDGFATINGGPDQDQYHFVGLDADPDGTDHAQFRNYQPVTAQWLSPDPYMGSYSAKNPQSFNRYAYVKNNPLMYVDPLGLEDQICGYVSDDDGDGGLTYSYCTSGDSGGDSPDDPEDPENPDDPYGGVDLSGTAVGFPAGTIWIPSSGANFMLVSGGAPNNNKQVPVHGIWHYGNFCGPDGMGIPINAVDAACQQHDIEFGNSGADWTNMQSEAAWQRLNPIQQEAVRKANQRLCDAMVAIGPSIPSWNVSERTAQVEIYWYFQSFIPKGAQCHQ